MIILNYRTTKDDRGGLHFITMKLQYVLSTKGEIYRVLDRDIYLDGNQYYAVLNNKRNVEICMIRDAIDTIMLANQHYLIEKRKVEKEKFSG